MSIEYIKPEFIRKAYADEFAPNYGRQIDGYGSKIPTNYRVLCADNRTRRVYAICFSNAASHYITYKGKKLYLAMSHHITDKL